MDTGPRRPLLRVTSPSRLARNDARHFLSFRDKIKRLKPLFLVQALSKIQRLPESQETILRGTGSQYDIHSRPNSIVLDQEVPFRNYHDRLNHSPLGLWKPSARYHWHNMVMHIVLSLDDQLGTLPSARPSQPLPEIRGVTGNGNGNEDWDGYEDGNGKQTPGEIGGRDDILSKNDFVQHDQEEVSSSKYHDGLICPQQEPEQLYFENCHFRT